MAYTTIDNPELHFQTKTYTGNGSTNAITLDGSENMQPDWVWVKDRGRTGYNHIANDSVRGVTKYLRPNLNNSEATLSDAITSFDSNGFTLGSDSSNGEHNVNSQTYVAWNWKAGTSFSNDASATGVGSIDSSGSTSSDAGFSIISYTGTGSAGTIAHNLGAAPAWLIFKKRSEARDWMVYHHKNTSAPETDFLLLNSTDATADNDNFMNDTAPTSSVFTVKGFNEVNKSGQTYICYAFKEVKGYSKFGSYTGNGNADGPFVYTGFKPAWVMFRRSDNTGQWFMHDNKRVTFNVDNKYLAAQDNAAEQTFTALDMLASGFKLRTSGTGYNASGGTYIYMCFAESPLVNSNGVPTNAR